MIVAAWDASGIHAAFLARRPSGAAEAATLFDTKTLPQGPFPYCTYTQPSPPLVQSRSSGKRGDGNAKGRQIREVPIQFEVWATKFGSTTGKVVAADLADLVMQQFGGSETAAVVELSMDGGKFLNCQYQTDFSIRQDDNIWSHVIRYNLWVDHAVAQ